MQTHSALSRPLVPVGPNGIADLHSALSSHPNAVHGSRVTSPLPQAGDRSPERPLPEGLSGDSCWPG